MRRDSAGARAPADRRGGAPAGIGRAPGPLRRAVRRGPARGRRTPSVGGRRAAPGAGDRPRRAAPGGLRPAAGRPAVRRRTVRPAVRVGGRLADETTLLALALVHEFLHIRLGALLDLVPLHQPNGAAVHHAPWRSDLRPIGALLQGAYAHLGVADFWRAEPATGSGGERRRAEGEFARWRGHALSAGSTLLDSAELTAHGREFTEELVCAVRELGGPE
ncbi:HEXXH motif-containing putative peptide modification protein [Kitasatospora sp. CM 4170]|uniref:HEXXH motif-containing putative peptide modification protein n=1 Tax=Kitasatospora aburaviensis TaxID=67265 RepID=A0ABW1EZX1_9ACTN|nr:HEXXH motif-containing putative peptide modification protein [Kitasatospora sp. CM 4170]WNM47263.1 HEXXH motif-containing putative peptide modification protein [Kitasatospora sp. CM 4170]